MQEGINPRIRERRGSYFARHWQGDLSLPISFWVNGLLIFGLGYNVLMALINLGPFVWEHTAWLGGNELNMMLVDMVIFVIAYVWAGVGVWRSAKKYQGPIFWSILAKMAIWFGIVSIFPWIMLWVLASRKM
jgi:hypothetical protein